MQDSEGKIRQTFKKSERLCSRTKIKSLFEKSNTINAWPIKLLWQKAGEAEKAPAMQLVISVPKRNIRKAVLRNKIRRRIREAYRRNKQLLLADNPENAIKCLAIFIFTGKEEITFQETEAKIILLLNRLKHEYAKAAR